MSNNKEILKKELFRKRINSEITCMKAIRNNNLVCKDCVFKIDDSERPGNTSVCEVFESKPNEVLLGGECKEYIKG